MEELQDAIEDAQYVNAISNVDDGPRPVLPWPRPPDPPDDPPEFPLPPSLSEGMTVG